jgi:serine O-acetyltransferase
MASGETQGNGVAAANGASAPHSSSAAPASSQRRRQPVPAPRGDRNENPPNIGLLELLREDYRTHESSVLSPGFLAVAVHRFGNWRMSVRFKPARAPLTVVYKAAHYSITWFFGIDLPYTAKLGRRVRLGHHGCMHLGARAIGDDVYIRHAATIGLMDPKERWAKPTIGDGVEIGPGACVLGDIVVGHDTVIGANTVLAEDVPPYSRVLGNPARHVDFAKLAEPPQPGKRGA